MELKNGAYQIQGVKVADLAREFGTPLYVYDAARIVAQLGNLRAAFRDAPMRIKYAAKALTTQGILRLMKRNGAGIDVVSIEEARLALTAGFDPSDVTFTPSGVSFSEITAAVELGLMVTLDNLSSLEHFGKAYGGNRGCSLRLNPDIMAGANLKVATGHGRAKFGIAVAQLEAVKTLTDRYKISVEGLHIHTGSEISDAGVFLQAADVFFEAAKGFPGLRFLDFGGGFKVPYMEGDAATDVTDIGRRLSEAFNGFCRREKKTLELWIEPGKYLVSEAGILIVSVNAVKETPQVTFACVDSGLNHLLRPMMYGAWHEIINVSNHEGSVYKYDVVGYICETDTFGTDRMLHEVREGDLLVLKNAGAYGYTMSSNYNSRLRPAEVIIEEGVPKLIRARDKFEDLLRGQA